MSKKLSQFTTKTELVGEDWLTGLDTTEPPASQNTKITKDNLFKDHAKKSEVAAVQANLDTHTSTGAGTAHPDGVTATELSNHKSGANEHPISSVTGLQTALDAKEDIANLGDAAYKNTGTLNTQVAAGDAPAAAVTGHETTFAHANLPSASQKAALNANPKLSGADAVAALSDIPAGGSTLHADLTDTDSDGHPGTVINIAGGVQGNAVSIAADGTLRDAGIPPGGGGGGGTQKGTPFVNGDLLAVQSSAGDGIVQSVGFAPSDVARLSVSNTFANAKQVFQSAAAVGFDIYQTGTTGQKGRWVVQSSSGLLVLRSTNDAGSSVEANPELRIGHGNNADKGAVMGTATFQGYATLNAENGLYDGGNRVYSAGNPPPGGGGGWDDGSTITDWGDTGQTITGSGAQTLDLDNGHFASGTLTASKTITFESTAAHGNTSWDVILASGGFTPTWAFTGATVHLPDGYTVSADATYWFTFRKVGTDVYVSERKMQ